MNERVFKYLNINSFAAYIFMAIVGAAVGLGTNTYFNPKVAVFTEVREDDGFVYPGDTLNIVAHVTRKRLCDSVANRLIWRSINGNPDDIEVIPLTRSPAPNFWIVDKRVTIKLQLPVNLALGKWHYQATTRNTCPIINGIINTTEYGQTEPLIFEVIPRPTLPLDILPTINTPTVH